MKARALGALLAVVAGSAAVLSFDALHGLARLCGFGPAFAPLLPCVIDCGAAAGSLVWLSQPAGRARVFGRSLALVLLVGSVAGNALGHGLAAYSARPHWLVVVAVSAVPPAVLGAVVHLLALVAQARTAPAVVAADEIDEQAEGEGLIDWWADAPPSTTESDRRVGADLHQPSEDRAAELIASGVGRRRLAKELGVSEHSAREMLRQMRVNGVPS